MIPKLIIRLIWTVTILLSDAILQTNYEHVPHRCYTVNWVTGEVKYIKQLEGH